MILLIVRHHTARDDRVDSDWPKVSTWFRRFDAYLKPPKPAETFRLSAGLVSTFDNGQLWFRPATINHGIKFPQDINM
jgi:hypothetical protein